MAIARVFDGKGWTPEQYDALMVRLVDGLQLPAGKPAAGVLFHWAAPTGDGLRAVDVYESREAADALAQESIGPLAAELGLPMPNITEYEVHAYLAR
jgi:hypothetical protein